ncbi:MAG TPA: phenylphosphate carboxylase subunit delta, partial [Chthonomonadaceae bacterium]|nr:phenylphosphate carboxylase subunit delta [Chthonomonadaceae bacterium]
MRSEVSDLEERLASIRLLALDVDGVLTDGAILYDSAGGEQKCFHVADGMGIVLMRLAGIAVAWLSARSDPIVVRRAAELQVPYLLQGLRNKGPALQELGETLGLERAGIAYAGDDWNDLPA